MAVSFHSSFPRLRAHARARAAVAVRGSAEAIAQGARDRVPVDTGDLEETIEVVQRSPLKARVQAGSREAFYPHMVENGTVRSAPRPFMLPAAEQEAPAFTRAMGEVVGE